MNFESSKNPNDAFRHKLLLDALTELDRPGDITDIIQSAIVPADITTISTPDPNLKVRVGVIGAGLAGLSAAYELRKIGCEVTIFEANPTRIGGRVNTHYFTEDLYGELGAMRIPVSHETTWHYINLFNLGTLPFIYNSPNNHLYASKVRLVGEDLDTLAMKYLYPHYNLKWWERNTPLSDLINLVYNEPILRLDPLVRNLILEVNTFGNKAINELDSLTFYNALKRLGISHGGMNLLNSTLGIDRGLFNLSYLELIREMYTANFYYVYRIENGNSQLPWAFYQSFLELSPLGTVSVKQGHSITGMSVNTQLNNVILRVKHQEKEYFESFDYVISAVPFSRLRLIDLNPLFSAPKMHAIRELHYSNSQKTLFLCNERFWDQALDGQVILGGSSITDLAITTIWYPGDKNTLSYGVITASYNIGLDAIRLGNLSDNERVEEIKREVEEVHGLPRFYLDTVVIDHQTINWNNDEYALGAFCWNAPMHHQLFAYPATTPEYNNKVFFAGEHISTYHAWMQGALQTGMTAANQVAFEIQKKKI